MLVLCSASQNLAYARLLFLQTRKQMASVVIVCLIHAWGKAQPSTITFHLTESRDSKWEGALAYVSWVFRFGGQLWSFAQAGETSPSPLKPA
jgi:hypothetical protein